MQEYRDARRIVVRAVSYEYAVPGRDSIRISGLGVQPNKGRLTYLTTDSVVVLGDPQTGAELLRVKLSATAVAQSGADIDLPSADDFGAAFREVPWKARVAFDVRAPQLVQRYFPSLLRSSDGQIQYITSTYQELPGMPRRARCKAAVRIAHPFIRPDGSITVRVQQHALDKPLKDTWDTATLPECRSAADAAVARLARELESR